MFSLSTRLNTFNISNLFFGGVQIFKSVALLSSSAVVEAIIAKPYSTKAFRNSFPDKHDHDNLLICDTTKIVYLVWINPYC